MTTTQITQRAIASLAALTSEVRRTTDAPPWDDAGIAAEIRRHVHVPLPALAIAMLRCATDPTNQTPAALGHPDNRAWHDFRPWQCKTHPEQHACRTDGECASCYADRKGSPQPARFDRRPPTAEARQARAGLKRAATQDGAT